MEGSFSARLSEKMRFAGFHSANAKIQSAMASVIEDTLRFLVKTDNLHLFGSYSDGWGSSLTQLDGSVEESSDIDVTIVSLSVQRKSFHLTGDLKNEHGQCHHDHLLTLYSDGHADISSRASAPNIILGDPNVSVFSAFDIIVALPCCGYPPIELLLPGYKNRRGGASRIQPHILQMLSDEVNSETPRCHVVVASPPNVSQGTRMRVSTTLLERALLRNLNTIQGQFFLIIKFLIKKVISERVTGPKIYMAKNLLFYMLDETPEDDWKPENLLTLVRKSLQMFVEMMQSSDSDDVCMKHFFLRDAAVYFKKDHQPKSEIIQEVQDVIQSLLNELTVFMDSLSEVAVTSVQFHTIFGLLLLVEMHESSHDEEQVMRAFHTVLEAHAAVTKHFSGKSPDEHLDALLSLISLVPDCAKVCREWLRALAHFRVGKSLDEAVEPFAYSISRGIACPPLGPELSFDEAKAAVLWMLADLEPMRVEVQNGKIVGSALKEQFAIIASLVAALTDGDVPGSVLVFSELLRSSPVLPLIFKDRKTNLSEYGATLLTQHLRNVVASGTLDSRDDDESNFEASGDHHRPLEEDELD